MHRIYLDYNATTPLEPAVLETIHVTLRDAWGNPSSMYDSGRQAHSALETARSDVARMIGASSKDIIFTSGGTEANNWVLHIAVEHFHQKSHEKNNRLNSTPDRVYRLPHVITTNIEHDSIKLPLENMSQSGTLDVTFVPVNPKTGCATVEDVVNAIRPSTCLVSVMLANNETGAIQPVEEIFKAVKNASKMRTAACHILTHTDAAQALGKIPVNAKDLLADYLTIVGHKFYGPRIGALYVNNPEIDSPLYPMLFGGGQERNFRPGTENVGLISGLGKAAQLVADNVRRHAIHMHNIREYLETKLLSTFSTKISFNNRYPDTKTLPNTCNVSFVGAGLEGHKVLAACRRLEASVGAACHAQGIPSPILIASGISSALAANALRLSIGRDTTREDIDAVVDDLQQAIQSLSSIYKLGLKPEAEQTKALDYSVERP